MEMIALSFFQLFHQSRGQLFSPILTKMRDMARGMVRETFRIGKNLLKKSHMLLITYCLSRISAKTVSKSGVCRRILSHDVYTYSIDWASMIAAVRSKASKDGLDDGSSILCWWSSSSCCQFPRFKQVSMSNCLGKNWNPRMGESKVNCLWLHSYSLPILSISSGAGSLWTKDCMAYKSWDAWNSHLSKLVTNDIYWIG